MGNGSQERRTRPRPGEANDRGRRKSKEDSSPQRPAYTSMQNRQSHDIASTGRGCVGVWNSRSWKSARRGSTRPRSRREGSPKRETKKSKIGKKKEQAGDGNSSDADGLGGEQANMTDA